MVDQIDYATASKEVDSIYSAEEKQIVVDVHEALNSENEIKTYDYAKAISSIESVEGKRMAEVRQPQKVAPSTMRTATAGTEAEVASIEIERLASYVGKGFSGNVEKEMSKIKKSELVLPTLSLQDQVSDLEKMSEGIDEGVFNEEQLGIIIVEVRGLGETLKYRKQEAGDEFQKHLVALRNQRLNEVITKLNAMKNT